LNDSNLLHGGFDPPDDFLCGLKASLEGRGEDLREIHFRKDFSGKKGLLFA
jgi:hypothetical protein